MCGFLAMTAEAVQLGTGAHASQFEMHRKKLGAKNIRKWTKEDKTAHKVFICGRKLLKNSQELVLLEADLEEWCFLFRELANTSSRNSQKV